MQRSLTDGYSVSDTDSPIYVVERNVERAKKLELQSDNTIINIQFNAWVNEPNIIDRLCESSWPHSQERI